MQNSEKASLKALRKRGNLSTFFNFFDFGLLQVVKNLSRSSINIKSYKSF